MSSIWQKQNDEWLQLKPSGFPSEESLHDLVQEAPGMLPLSGDPTVTVLGREVSLGSGFADLVGVESDGRLVVLEIKLRKNAEAKRAVVAQVLTYAAHLKGLGVPELEQILHRSLKIVGATSIVEAARNADESGDFDDQEFAAGLIESLELGSFRLVLVLDEAPHELVQLVGYLESVSSGIAIDLITVASYEVGDEQVLVPQRVDPAYEPEIVASSPVAKRRATKARRESEGSDGFEQSIESASEGDQASLRNLLEWARSLEEKGLAQLRSVLGETREILLVWVPGEKGGLVSIWNDNGAYLSLWRSMFVRRAWKSIEAVEQATGSRITQGGTIEAPSEDVLGLLTDAYVEAVSSESEWNGRDYYVSFGENDQRDWDEARSFGFVAAGGGAWHSNSLRGLKPGNRVFAYIPTGRGVGGYVGFGEVTGEPRMAKDFEVEVNGIVTPYLEATESPNADQFRDDPENAEWVVPVRWIDARTREDAVKDSDFFANQNSAVKLTHGFTLEKLYAEFAVRD